MLGEGDRWLLFCVIEFVVVVSCVAFMNRWLWWCDGIVVITVDVVSVDVVCFDVGLSVVCVWVASGICGCVELWIWEWSSGTGMEVIGGVVVRWRWGICVGVRVGLVGEGILEIDWHRGGGER